MPLCLSPDKNLSRTRTVLRAKLETQASTAKCSLQWIGSVLFHAASRFDGPTGRFRSARIWVAYGQE